MACGLSSIQVCANRIMFSPMENNSVNMARQLYDGAVIDEYTSVVNGKLRFHFLLHWRSM